MTIFMTTLDQENVNRRGEGSDFSIGVAQPAHNGFPLPGAAVQWRRRPKSVAPALQALPAMRHTHRHAFTGFCPLEREGLTVLSRRNLFKAGLAGLAGLTVPELLRQRAEAAAPAHKSVILLWMTGGPSHIDTWDVKPDRPVENRGPFASIATRLPGVRICEHLPRQAAMLDRFTLLRAVDCATSNHEPNTVMQTAMRDAEPRTNPLARMYPAIGSIVARHHGPNHPGLPPYVVFQTSRTHIAYAGWLGRQHDPFPGHLAARLPICTNVGVDTGRTTEADLFRVAAGLSFEQVQERQSLLASFDTLRRDLDASGAMEAMDRYSQQAVELVLGRRAQDAFDLGREPAAVRKRYGRHLWCQQALLARRLVEAGVAFVTIDLSYHPASGTWDTHGDNIPPYGGIRRGLGPLLPLFDHLITTLVSDLEQRGLLDNVLVIAMGEFGRTPQVGTQESTDGRNHWPVVMSAALAGGGLRHGQVIGASTADGGQIRDRPVTPGDLAATIYRHMGVPVDATYQDHTGRPRRVLESGSVIGELV
jgi:uncharacterized protein (DUF1501 family)